MVRTCKQCRVEKCLEEAADRYGDAGQLCAALNGIDRRSRAVPVRAVTEPSGEAIRLVGEPKPSASALTKVAAGASAALGVQPVRPVSTESQSMALATHRPDAAVVSQGRLRFIIALLAVWSFVHVFIWGLGGFQERGKYPGSRSVVLYGGLWPVKWLDRDIRDPHIGAPESYGLVPEILVYIGIPWTIFLVCWLVQGQAVTADIGLRLRGARPPAQNRPAGVQGPSSGAPARPRNNAKPRGGVGC